MGRLTRTEINKRRARDRAWGNPSGDPAVEPSYIGNHPVAMIRNVRASADPIRMPSRDRRRTENERRWDK